MGAEYFFYFPADKVAVMVLQVAFEALYDMRSEERRVGKECW